MLPHPNTPPRTRWAANAAVPKTPAQLYAHASVIYPRQVQQMLELFDSEIHPRWLLTRLEAKFGQAIARASLDVLVRDGVVIRLGNGLYQINKELV